MNLVGRIAVVLTCGVTLAACSGSPPPPEPPSFDTAKRALVKDATELLTTAEVKVSGNLRATERAEKDDNGDCIPGKVQRFFRAEGNFIDATRQSPGVAAGLIGSRLGLERYDHLVDDLDLFDNDMSVVVVRKPEVGVTFIIAARTTKEPNILIVGKTDCFDPKK